MTRKSTIAATAYHEAGHAVVHLVLRHQFTTVNVFDPPMMVDGRGVCTGLVTFDDKPVFKSRIEIA